MPQECRKNPTVNKKSKVKATIERHTANENKGTYTIPNKPEDQRNVMTKNVKKKDLETDKRKMSEKKKRTE